MCKRLAENDILRDQKIQKASLLPSGVGSGWVLFEQVLTQCREPLILRTIEGTVCGSKFGRRESPNGRGSGVKGAKNVVPETTETQTFCVA